MRKRAKSANSTGTTGGLDEASVSTWARGQAWGRMGFTMMYRETNDPKYLRHGNISPISQSDHLNLLADESFIGIIPAAGFNLRDTSAASIMASALIELSTYSANKDYFKTGEISKPSSTSISPNRGSILFILKQAIETISTELKVIVIR